MPVLVRRALVPAVLVAAILAAACAAKRPPAAATAVRAPTGFSASGEVPPPVRWWTSFEDPALEDCVARALEGNLDLEALAWRIAEARATARREAAALFPELEGFVTGELASRDGENASSLELGAAAAYEVDLFDRIESAVVAERVRARATQADRSAAALTLAAAVATTFYELREAALQLALLDEQIAFNEQIRELIEARVATQQLRGVDLLRQRELIEATREQQIVERGRARLLENALAVLLGTPPGAEPPEVTVQAGLPALPPPPATGLPIELVRRRPDIQAARLRACAADRDLAAALNECYPRLELTASLSTLDSPTDDIFRSWVTSFAAGLLAPLFDGGRRVAEMRRTLAVRERLLAEYGQTVLIAFQEVEDALVREALQRERVASLERQAALAAEATERLRRSYLDGVGDYIDVLSALTDKQQLERSLLTNQRLLLDARIALYRALAGGFEPPAEPYEG